MKIDVLEYMKIRIDRKKEKEVDVPTGKNAFVREGKIYLENQEEYDIAFRNYENKCLFSSSYCFLKIPIPVGKVYSIFYINSEQFENQILIGNTFVDLKYISNGPAIELYSFQRDKDFVNKGTLKNIDEITLLSRYDDLFEDFNDETMSNSHCYVGYKADLQMFYVIDYGSTGEGSSNGTYVKAKNTILEIKKDKTSFRIIKELPHEKGSKKFFDYKIDCNLSWLTKRTPVN